MNRLLNNPFNNAPLRSLILALALAGVGGCTATHTALNKNELDVQTSMSSTIWLDPVRADLRTVFLQIRNTSGYTGLDIQAPIRDALMARGFVISEDPEQAHYWLQANILKIDKHDLNDHHEDHGFGSAVVGGAIGNQFGDGDGEVAATIAGAVIGMAVDASVDDTEYVMITDLQIAEKARLPRNQASTGSGYSSNPQDRQRYQTRIISTANQANLALADARPLLVTQLVNAVGGMF